MTCRGLNFAEKRICVAQEAQSAIDPGSTDLITARLVVGDAVVIVNISDSKHRAFNLDRRKDDIL